MFGLSCDNIIIMQEISSEIGNIQLHFFLLYTIYVRKNHQDHQDEVPMIYWANELCSHFFTQVSFVSSRKIYIIAVADVIILSQSINMWVEVT